MSFVRTVFAENSLKDLLWYPIFIFPEKIDRNTFKRQMVVQSLLVRGKKGAKCIFKQNSLGLLKKKISFYYLNINQESREMVLMVKHGDLVNTELYILG